MIECRHHFASMPHAKSESTSMKQIYGSSEATLYRCQDCGHHFFSPPAKAEDVYRFYNEEFGRHNIDHEYSDFHLPYVQRLNDELRQLLGVDSLRIHDEGCGFGHLVWLFNKCGANATGTDIGTSSIELGRARGNHALSDKTAAAFLGERSEQVDAMMMVHSLEHYVTPLESLSELQPFLADRGVFFFLIPNANYLPVIRLGMGADPHCWFPMHMQFFTPKSFARMLALAGLSILSIETTPFLGFSPTMADDLLFSAVGRRSSDLRDPGALIQGLVSNLYGYEMRVLAVRSDSRHFAGRTLSEADVAKLPG